MYKITHKIQCISVDLSHTKSRPEAIICSFQFDKSSSIEHKKKKNGVGFEI